MIMTNEQIDSKNEEEKKEELKQKIDFDSPKERINFSPTKDKQARKFPWPLAIVIGILGFIMLYVLFDFLFPVAT